MYGTKTCMYIISIFRYLVNNININFLGNIVLQTLVATIINYKSNIRLINKYKICFSIHRSCIF